MEGVEKSDERRRVVCCVGDIHGYASKLKRLWSNMEARLSPPVFSTALIIFLGDYCDRGPHTDEVIDFLLSLPSLYPFQSHVFLCGNHDFAFASFVNALPATTTNLKSTWEEYAMYEDREGWFRGEGFESMHLQGRRWGGLIKERWNAKKGTEYKGSIYDAAPTFLSYNVPHGSQELVKAVPEDHKKFLADLVWVHEEDDVYIDTSEGTLKCKLVAVHAGLDKSKDVQQQIRLLKQRDTSISKVEALSGRQSVWDIPKELAEKQTIVVSGHHGKLHIDGLRLIIDESGGLEENPIAAVVLPSLMIVRDTDDVANQA